MLRSEECAIRGRSADLGRKGETKKYGCETRDNMKTGRDTGFGSTPIRGYWGNYKNLHRNRNPNTKGGKFASKRG